MFTSARLKLTLWYFCIIVLISFSLSSLYYFSTVQVLQREYDRMDQRLQLELRELPFSHPPRYVLRQILPEDLEVAKHRIRIQLLGINGVIILASTALGYILSGKTLEPIRIALKEQQRFVGDAAHELRTPITALKTSLEVNLMDTTIPKPFRRILLENLDDVLRLENLTESLIKISRVDAQRSNFEMVEPLQIITEAIKTVTSLSAKKNIEISLATGFKSGKISGDRHQLKEVFVIILDNAIKYSPENTTIHIVGKETKQSITISIHDQGFGIPKKDLPHIFDRFYRIDQARLRHDVGGFGLGLSMAKKIIDEHHAQIKVVSEIDKGTSFTLRFPKIL